MRTTLAFEGATELILQKAVELGLARSKTDALRLGVFALNREYSIVKNLEGELAARKMIKTSNEIKQGKIKVFTEKQVKKKYGFK